MNYLNILSLISISIAFLARIKASESGDFSNLVEEKARIKADLEEMRTKPTPGQLIFSIPTKPTAPSPAEESPEIRQMATPTVSPRASKPKKKEEKHEESEDEEVKKEEPKKKEKIQPKKKKPSSSTESSSSSDSEDYKKSKNDGSSDELPKRLFRPRFRAESSADSIKSSSIIITLAVSLLGLLFI